VSIFGTLCLLLGVAGVFAVAAAEVSGRTREIGVRMALGAAPAQVAKHMVGSSLLPILLGLLVGTLLTVALGRLWQSRLFDVNPWDPATLLVAGLTMGGAALVASWVPALRASRMDPNVALRSE
jgi:ABC-type antimicrobial peptide transport system permease subunit